MDAVLKILIIPGTIPYPPDDGGKICTYGFVDSLRTKHHISIVFKCSNAGDLSKVEKLMNEWPDVQIYYTLLNVSEKKFSIVIILKRILAKIYHYFKFKFVVDHYQKGLNASKTTPFYPQTKEYVNLVVDILKENQFNIIQTERIEDINLVHLFPSDAKKIFVQIENRAEIINDYGIVNQVSKTHLDYIVKNTEFLEDQYMKLYDAVFTLNNSDRTKIQNRLTSVNIYNSPFAILDKDIKKIDHQNLNLENLIFIGSEGHFPNLDGLEWFLQYSKEGLTLPRLKHIYVTGVWTQSTKRRLRALDDRLVFLGFVEDLSPFLKNSITIVPIRIGGGGIRTKILLAMAQNSPVISTTTAAVGITGEHKNHLWIADTIDRFIEGINFLFENQEFSKKLTESANHLIRIHYSQAHVSLLRHRLYLDICSQ
jgi:hypothetical protein